MDPDRPDGRRRTVTPEAQEYLTTVLQSALWTLGPDSRVQKDQRQRAQVEKFETTGEVVDFSKGDDI